MNRFWQKSAILIASFFLSGFFFSFFSHTALAADVIRVTGFAYPRSPYPLDENFEWTDGTFSEYPVSYLPGRLEDPANFGTEGIVKCATEFEPLISYIYAGSLVVGDERLYDVFFGGVNDELLTTEEAEELASFVEKGGIVYLSGPFFQHSLGEYIPRKGKNYNPLFDALGVDDEFSDEFTPALGGGLSSDPTDSVVTNGPFGDVGPVTHEFFNIFTPDYMSVLAYGYDEVFGGGTLSVDPLNPLFLTEVLPLDPDLQPLILAGQFGQGYVLILSWPAYIGDEYIDPEAEKYYLNLFALACGGDVLSDSDVAPFLDLPWDYSSKGLYFREAALSLNSFFDHEYPLLSTNGLVEPNISKNQVTTFQGENSTTKSYSSHDGYDWGRAVGAGLGTDVLAAADGCARYYYNSASGNAILIDHGNDYQTRYYHLLPTGLITNSQINCVEVNHGQKIGEVGATGRTTGAHIHFMVVEDKDEDGDFEDNIPDGVTDPFGWFGGGGDPWPSYEFQYRDEDGDGILDNHTGNASHYLWLADIYGFSGLFYKDQLNEILAGRYNYSFPAGTFDEDIKVTERGIPTTTFGSLVSLGSGSEVVVIDGSGNPIFNPTLYQDFELSIDFSNFDLSLINPDTISIYSSQDGTNWAKEDTQVNLADKLAYAQIDHLSQFALMAEKSDSVPPITEMILSGDEGDTGWFRSSVTVSFSVQDDLEVDYTLYKLDQGEWQVYQGPFEVTDEGSHKVEYYSVDNAENIEDKKQVEFNVDKTHPELKIVFDPVALDTDFLGVDDGGETTVDINRRWFFKDKVRVSDRAGNILEVLGKLVLANKSDAVVVDSVKYNDEVRFEFDSNLYFNYYSTWRNGSLRNLTQEWFDKNSVLMLVTYMSSDGKSVVYEKVVGEPVVRDVRDGVTLLYVQTNNGNLVFGYE